jgi:hypothetical protein
MKSLALVRVSLLVASALAAACGGQSFGGDFTGDAATDGGGGGDSGGVDGGGGDGGLVPGCPASAPSTGTACAEQGLACEYGTDSNVNCNTVARCQSGSWQVTPPGDLITCPSPGVVPGCPSSFADVPRGTACSPNGLICGYPQGRCTCNYGFGGPVPVDAGSGSWRCENPNAGCPTPRPRIGSSCSVPATLVCDYGGCMLPGGTDLQCLGGTWTEQPVACPAGAGVGAK